ncbi:MAG TPA: sigma-70 family RNA polymerase sigma factor [Bryobacteraceae bacterium]|nr:sigma-70 family RNA polymerase sigma factor [Bryobacteraceae bacterium]
MTPTPLDREVLQLYEAHAAALMRYARTLARDPETARDAVQEAFLRYFVERRYSRLIERPQSWLLRVVRNYLLDQLKTAESRLQFASDIGDSLVDDGHDPEAILRQAELVREISAALTGREWECLCLRTEGLSYAEIAESLGLCHGTVGALLTRAQRKIRLTVQETGGAAQEAPLAAEMGLDPGQAYTS